MPPIPDARLTINDGALGLLPANTDQIGALIGVASQGIAGTLYTFNDIATLRSTLGVGPLVEAAAFILAKAGGPIRCMPVTAGVAGSNGSVSKSNGSSPTVSVSGTPKDGFDAKIVILTGGARGTATFKYSLDGGLTYSDEILVPSGGAYTLGDTGLTATFAAGTYTAGDTFSFTSTAPGFNTTNLTTALDALLASPKEFAFVYVVGEAATPDDAIALGAVLATKMDEAEAAFRYTFGLVEIPWGNGNEAGTVKSAAGPFDLRFLSSLTGVLVIAFETGGSQSFNLAATSATKAGSGATYSSPTGKGVTLKIDGGALQTVTLGAGATDAAGAAASINAQIVGGRAVVNGTEVDIRSDRKGTGSSVQIVAETGTPGALACIGHSAGTATGTGDVSNLGAVTAAELAAKLSTLTNGTAAATNAGELVLTSATTGASSSAQVVASSTADTTLGFDNDIHAGAASTDTERDDEVADAVASAASTRLVVGAGRATVVSPISGRQAQRNAALLVAARIAATPIHEDLARVIRGPLSGVLDVERDEQRTPGLDEERVCTLRTIIGRTGFYITNGRLLAGAGSDYKYIQFRRVMDKACKITRDTVLDFLNESFRVNADGTIDERDAIRIESKINAALEAGIVTPGSASASSILVSRTQNLTSTQMLALTVRVTPLGYAKSIAVDIGFANPTLAVEASA
jgi:hypothetical protein